MLPSGMLIAGLALSSVFAASRDVDPGRTSETAQEMFTEETSEAPAVAGEMSEIEETSEAPAAVGEPTKVDETSEIPAYGGKTAEEASGEEEAEAQYYTVTLDANDGYFENEWDDAIGDYVSRVELVEKHVFVDGTVATFPVFTDQDGQSMVFTGWSLERDGELVAQAEGEYIPVVNSLCAIVT